MHSRPRIRNSRKLANVCCSKFPMTDRPTVANDDGYVFTCLSTGEITQVLLPVAGARSALPLGVSLLDIVLADHRETARLFLHTLQSLAFTADWPLDLSLPT